MGQTKRNGRTSAQGPKPVPHYLKEECDWAYSEAVYPKLARKYPNRWIALAHHRVVASGKNLMKVLSNARQHVDWEEIPLVFVERGIHVYLIHGHHP